MTGHSQASQFMEEVMSLLEAENYALATKVFNDVNHQEYLRNNSWDLIPALCKHITMQEKLKNNQLAVCCESLLEKLAAEANPEEAVLEFLDQMDTADANKFEVILKLLRIILSQEMTNWRKSLEWTLNSIRSYTEQFSFGANSNEMDCTEDIETFYNNDKVKEMEYVMNSILTFYESFVNEVTETSEADLKYLLSSRLLQMFDIYLPYIDIELFPQFKVLQWKTINLLLQLISNPMTLLEFVFYRSLNVMKSKSRKPSILDKDIDSNSLSSENFSALDLIEYMHPLEDETIVSNLAYGMFFYSLLIEAENEQIRVPMVYNPKYVMLSLIYVTVSFFDQKTDITVRKGLTFLDFLLNQLNNPLTKSDLYFSSHKAILIHLNNIMIFSQVEENRKLALTCFRKYIESFNWEGRYLLLLNFRSHVHHSGTLGFLIGLLKEFVSTFLELPMSSQQHYKFLKYYKGKLLFDMIKKYCFLKNGANTDLVENADHIISSLNALRYLVLRDKKNITDIKNFMKKINEGLLEPLKENIGSSRKFYDLKLKDLESSESKSSLASGGSEIDIELAVKGQTLPKLTRDQQKMAYHSCLNAVDLIDSLLNRLIECVNETYPRSL